MYALASAAASSFEVTVAARNPKHRVCTHMGVFPLLECGKHLHVKHNSNSKEFSATHPHAPHVHLTPGFI